MAHFYCRVTGSVGKVTRSTMLQIGWTARGQSQSVWSSVLANHKQSFFLSWPIAISLSLLTNHNQFDHLSWPITISLSLLTNHNLLDYLFWPMKIRSHTDCFDQSQAISVLSVFCVHCPKNNLNLCTYYVLYISAANKPVINRCIHTITRGRLGLFCGDWFRLFLWQCITRPVLSKLTIEIHACYDLVKN